MRRFDDIPAGSLVSVHLQVGRTTVPLYLNGSTDFLAAPGPGFVYISGSVGSGIPMQYVRIALAVEPEQKAAQLTITARRGQEFTFPPLSFPRTSADGVLGTVIVRTWSADARSDAPCRDEWVIQVLTEQRIDEIRKGETIV